MPLITSNIQIPLNAGIDQETDPRLLPAGRMTNLKNGVYSKAGAVSKRLGYEQMAVSGSGHPVMQKLMTFQNQLLAVNNEGDQLYSFSEATSRFSSGSFNTCRLPEASARRASISQNTSNIMSVDMMSTQNSAGKSFLVFSWVSNASQDTGNIPVIMKDNTTTWNGIGIWKGDVNVMVLDEETQSTLLPPTVVASSVGINPRLTLTGPDYVTLTWVERTLTGSSPNKVFAATLNLASNPSWQATRTQVSNQPIDDFLVYDVCSTGHSASGGTYPVYMAYSSNGIASGTVATEKFNAANLANISNSSFHIDSSCFPTIFSIGTTMALDANHEGYFDVIYTAPLNVNEGAQNGFYSFWYNRLQTGSIGTLYASALVDNIRNSSGSYLFAASNLTAADQSHVYAAYQANSVIASSYYTQNDQPFCNAKQISVSGASATVLNSGSLARKNLFVQMIGKPFLRYNKEINDYKLYVPGRTRFNTRQSQRYYELNSGQGTMFLFDTMVNDTTSSAMSWRPIATAATRLANVIVNQTFQNWGFVPNSPTSNLTSDDNVYTVGIIEQADQSTGRGGVEMISYDFSPFQQFESAEIGKSLNISAGTPSYFDGVTTGEIGFLYYPEQNIATVVEAPGARYSGAGLLTGTYQYSFVYEWIDNKGTLHQSAPSPQTSITLTANPFAGRYYADVDIQVPTLSIGTRQLLYNTGSSAVGLAIYRSLRNGNVLYRLTPDVVSTTLRNDPLQGYILYTDTQDDTTSALATHAPIYTTGGPLAAFCPPSAKFACTHVSRLWLAGCDNPKQVWYSKQYSDGTALAFNDQFTFTVDDGGDITGIIGGLDNNLIIFKSDRIFFVQGQGPNELGQQNDLSDPVLIPSDVGCVEHRSIVMTPDGVMFRSAKGLHLLTRAFQVVNVGPPVHDLLQTYPITTSAVIYPAQNQVRFTVGRVLSNGLYEGAVLVYDYLIKAWSYHVLADTRNGLTGSMQSDAIDRNGTYLWSSKGNDLATITTGSVYSERSETDSNAYRDGNTFVPLTVETAWVATNDIAGFQRVRQAQVLGSVHSTCDVTMSLGNDYDTSYIQSAAFGSVPAQEVFQRQVHVGQQKCQAIRVKVEDAPSNPDTGSGQGLDLTRVVLRAGVKQGLQKLPPNKRA